MAFGAREQHLTFLCFLIIHSRLGTKERYSRAGVGDLTVSARTVLSLISYVSPGQQALCKFFFPEPS